MEYRGIRYTVRAGIAREWFVSIYPDGNEVAAKRTFDARPDAEFQAHRMINRWLEPCSSMQGWRDRRSHGDS